MIKVNVTKFRSSYADANPEWLVIEKRGKGTWIAEIINCPDYSGTIEAFTTEQITKYINFSKWWNKSANDSENFYNNLKTGAIVHYNNGFNAYVRCKVLDDKQLLPIALVGKWSALDLPRRYDSGEIYNGYHADKIIKGTKSKFQPHASNIYEYQNNPKDIDPRNLQPIDLSVPPMTKEQEIKAAKVKKLEKIREIIDGNSSYDEQLQAIKEIINNP